jgi:hypothetical protein
MLVGLVVLAPGLGSAQTGSIAHDPTGLVAKYLELDAKGVRLDAFSQETLAPYVTWNTEPLWGHTVVITGYRVVDELSQWSIISHAEVVIPVEYRVLGSVYWEQPGFLHEPKLERVGYRVKIVGDRWRIAEPLLPPHVGHKRMINYIRQAILEEQDQAKAAILQAVLEALKKATHAGPASAPTPR